VLNNVAAAETLTSGRTLAGDVDSPVGTCLEIRQSMVEKLFPTRLDVPLLAHARLVDISDTEMLMGDDDGYMAVVVANRLPVASTDGSPVKYTACLVNLEAQWDLLLARAPAAVLNTALIDSAVMVDVNRAQMDQHRMAGATFAPSGTRRAARVAEPRLLPNVVADVSESVQASTSIGYTRGKAAANGLTNAAMVDMLQTSGVMALADPLRRFPVLLSWRFTTTGNTTFQALMEGLDSQLLGSTPKVAPASDAGRLPLEIVDTGHVGLEQRTRRGDSVRAWYRGPFVPHPTDDSSRLPLAHAADQVRIVVPDGREDLSLASAFEIGRLLALANPNMVAALLRWRQMQYAVVRQTTLWLQNELLLGQLNGFTLTERYTAGAATDLVRAFIRTATDAPEQFLGDPRPAADPGRALPFDGDANRLLSSAFALPTFRGGPDAILETLQKAPVRTVPVTDTIGRVPGAGFRPADLTILDRTLVTRVETLVRDTVVRIGASAPEPEPPPRGRRAPSAKKGAARKSTTRKTPAPRDGLDALIDRLSRRADDGERDA
jgi:hypothetical protein